MLILAIAGIADALTAAASGSANLGSPADSSTPSLALLPAHRIRVRPTVSSAPPLPTSAAPAPVAPSPTNISQVSEAAIDVVTVPSPAATAATTTTINPQQTSATPPVIVPNSTPMTIPPGEGPTIVTSP